VDSERSAAEEEAVRESVVAEMRLSGAEACRELEEAERSVPAVRESVDSERAAMEVEA